MDRGTVVRTAVLAVALINQCLVMFGKSPLPFNAEATAEIASFIFTLVTTMWAWFKNNYVTKSGKMQKKVLIENGLLIDRHGDLNKTESKK